MKKCKKSIIFTIVATLVIGAAAGCSKKTNKTENPTESTKGNDITKITEWNGVTINSVGSAKGDAVINGSDVKVILDGERNDNVLSLGGSGYLEFPEKMFDKIKDGFTISLDVKLSANCDDGANIFQFNPCGYGLGDKQWRDAPEISVKANLLTTFYIGGRTIGGVFTSSATYNNGIEGTDDIAYAEPNGHKTRYAATAGSALDRSGWHKVVLSVAKDNYSLYLDGVKVAMTDTVAGSDIASSLDYLFGDSIIKTYVVNSIGGSVYDDTKGFEGMVDNVAFYDKALSEAEVKDDKTEAYFKWDFSNDSIKADTAEYVSDLTKYLGKTAIQTVDGVEMVSPDGKLQVILNKDADNRYYYAVKHNNTVIVEPSAIGLELDGLSLTSGLSFDAAKVAKKSINETFALNTGNDKTANNVCNEVTIPFTKDNAKFDFIVRIFDDGFAFRYDEVTVDGKTELTVKSETSEFVLSDKATTWSHNINGTYEAEYVKRTNKQLVTTNSLLSTPLLAQSDGYYILLTEASVYNNDGEYCSSGLKTPAISKQLIWNFGLARDPNKESTGELDSPGHISITEVKTVNGFTTPWRVAIISNDPDVFVNSDIIACLNDAPDSELFADTSYIKPGKVAWSWWAEEGAQGTYSKHIEYIDFAADNGWEYVTLDVGWRAFEGRLAEMCEYAKSKGVGLFVWVNYRDIKDYSKMESLFKKWAEAGAVGLKTDYFESDAPEVLACMQHVAEVAAQNKLMVVYHGCVRPAGEYRTYPNVLTMEAVLGEEAHKWSNVPSVENCLLYPFTRNICGSMDYTPIAAGAKVNGETYGFGIAKAVVYQSALQHFANAVSVYKRYNGLSLLNNIYTVWDETKVFDGVAGEYISLMRRNGDDFFLGAMTLKAGKAEYTLDFLGDGEYNAYIYADNEDGSALDITSQKVKKGDKLSFNLLTNGGVAVMITKKTVDIDAFGDPYADNPDYTYYEAESDINTLSGTAKTAMAVMCSGSQKVGYVGNGANNLLTFNKITVDADGEYEVVIFYCSGEDRKVEVTVNGTDKFELTGLNSGSYDSFDTYTCTMKLKAGENTIMFGNASYYAPDFDRIAVAKKAK